LRREEVAQLCGMSATWYTWIEQGRDVAASPAALGRLAQVLQLSPAERAYLFELASRRDPARPAPAAMDAPPALVAALAAIAQPAYVLDRSLTARAWNAAAARLFVGWLDGPKASGHDRNLLRYIFLSKTARRLIVDWEERAHRVAAEFRADTTRLLDDPAIAALIEDLRARAPAFRRMWDEQAVVDRAGGLRSFAHPDGLQHYEQLTFTLTSRPEFKLAMLVPAKPPRGRATHSSQERGEKD
jgi:transcriptional regulator with XRE-family HTH domain